MQTNQSENNKEKTPKKKTNMLLASFVLFVFPIVAVFIGVFLGQYSGKLIGAPIQISRIIGGIIGFVLAIVLIKLFDKHAVIDAKEEKLHWEDL
jgi:small neutral amino acid transporter SnatA (MarC family)